VWAVVRELIIDCQPTPSGYSGVFRHLCTIASRKCGRQANSNRLVPRSVLHGAAFGVDHEDFGMAARQQGAESAGRAEDDFQSVALAMATTSVEPANGSCPVAP